MPNMRFKWGAFVGAVIVDERVWKNKSENQKIMMDIANDIGQKYQKVKKMEKKAIEVCSNMV